MTRGGWAPHSTLGRLTLRLYGSQAAALDSTWSPPPIVAASNTRVRSKGGPVRRRLRGSDLFGCVPASSALHRAAHAERVMVGRIDVRVQLLASALTIRERELPARHGPPARRVARTVPPRAIANAPFAPHRCVTMRVQPTRPAETTRRRGRSSTDAALSPRKASFQRGGGFPQSKRRIRSRGVLTVPNIITARRPSVKKGVPSSM